MCPNQSPGKFSSFIRSGSRWKEIWISQNFQKQLPPPHLSSIQETFSYSSCCCLTFSTHRLDMLIKSILFYPRAKVSLLFPGKLFGTLFGHFFKIQRPCNCVPDDELATESESISPDDLLHQLQRDVFKLVAFKNLILRSFRSVKIICENM